MQPLILILAFGIALGHAINVDNKIGFAFASFNDNVRNQTFGTEMLPFEDDGNVTAISLPETPLNNFMRLAVRQGSCASGQVACPDGDCCRSTETCVPSGCCPRGQSGCGDRYCYSPSTHHCCADGSGACRKGYDCTPTGCCPSGQVLCGTKCYDPKKSKCCSEDGDGGTCPKGYDCVDGGCCTSGKEPCPDDPDKCYNPRTETCCSSGGTCKKDYSCCEEECCSDKSYCASDGYCSLCPAETRTVMTTKRTQTTETATMTVTRGTSRRGSGGFTCNAMTVTNDDSQTLVMGTDCALTFSASSSAASNRKRAYDDTTSTIPAWSPAEPTSDHALLRRQRSSCSPWTTWTDTSTRTLATTSTTTSSFTVSPIGDMTFSCEPTAVTNTAGDVLELDRACELSWSQGAGPTQGPAGQGRDGGGGEEDAAVMMRSERGRWVWLLVGGMMLVAL